MNPLYRNQLRNMNNNKTPVYFSLKGEDFDPQKVTEILGIAPNESWQKGERGHYNSELAFSSWILSTSINHDFYDVNLLIKEIIDQLYAKIEAINEVKLQYVLESVLQIVLYIDTNEDNTTPYFGHDLNIIDFLYRTQTTTDVDIHRFTSLSV